VYLSYAVRYRASEHIPLMNARVDRSGTGSPGLICFRTFPLCNHRHGNDTSGVYGCSQSLIRSTA
jgi:hypothetical protein